MHLRPIENAEVQTMEDIRRAYREWWAKTTLAPCRFEGTRDDIDALDYFDYEGIAHPAGLDGAAAVWGSVLAKAGGLTWAVGDETHFVLVREEYPRQLIFPYARVAEIQRCDHPQFGKFRWLLEEAVVQLCPGIGLDEESALKALLVDPIDEGFLNYIRHWLKQN